MNKQLLKQQLQQLGTNIAQQDDTTAVRSTVIACATLLRLFSADIGNIPPEQLCRLEGSFIGIGNAVNEYCKSAQSVVGTEVQNLKRDMETAQGELQRQTDEKKRREVEKADIMTEIRAVTSQVEKLREEKSRYDDELKKQTEENRLLTVEVPELYKQVENAKAQVENLQAIVPEIQFLVKENNENGYDDIKGIIDKATKWNQSATKLIAEYSSDMSSISEQLEKIQKKIEGKQKGYQ